MNRNPILRLAVLYGFVLSVGLVAAAEETAESAVDPSRLTLERIFEEKEFKIERYGPARWLEDGPRMAQVENVIAEPAEWQALDGFTTG